VQVWGSPLPSSLPEGWRQDPGVRQVVGFADYPGNPPAQGAKQIVAFAAPLGADREERLLLLFAGLLDKFNFLREFALEACATSCCALRSYAMRSRRMMRRWRPKVGLGWRRSAGPTVKPARSMRGDG
jgi:hypothetical protein